jgi:spore maturation protein CgeB
MVRAGHTVALVDDRRMAQWVGRRLANAWLRARVRAFRPDRLIVGKGRYVEPDTLAEACAGRPSVMWYQDLRVPPLEDVVERARLVDVLFLIAAGQVTDYRARGVRRALFLPSALDAWMEGPAEPAPEFETDVAFVGTGYDAYRGELLVRLSRRFRLRVWGPGWEGWSRDLDWAGRAARGPDHARVCASAKIVLGIDPSFQVNSPVWGYASNRMWRVPGCGGFFLGHATPGMRELLVDGEHCGWYDDEEHAFAQIDRYLGDDAARRRIRAEGRAFVAAHHTFDRRVENLLGGAPFVNPLTGAPFGAPVIATQAPS